MRSPEEQTKVDWVDETFGGGNYEMWIDPVAIYDRIKALETEGSGLVILLKAHVSDKVWETLSLTDAGRKYSDREYRLAQIDRIEQERDAAEKALGNEREARAAEKDDCPWCSVGEKPVLSRWREVIAERDALRLALTGLLDDCDTDPDRLSVLHAKAILREST